MNIKIKHLRSYKYAVLTAVLALSFAAVSTATVFAATAASTEDPVLAYCKKQVPKAKDSCPQAAREAKNVASYKCVKAKKPQSCIRDKAKAYIKKASAGKPKDDKFKKQLDTIFKKEGGDKTRAADGTEDSTNNKSVFGAATEEHPCGGGDDIVYTKFDFGCIGPSPDAPQDLTPIMDLLFSLIRFMSTGVGLILVASIIYAGIQYSTSEGSPEATMAAKTRIKDAFIGLLIYIFAFSLIQFLVPGGVFH